MYAVFSVFQKRALTFDSLSAMMLHTDASLAYHYGCIIFYLNIASTPSVYKQKFYRSCPKILLS